MLGRWVRKYWKRVLLFLLLFVSCILVYLGYCSYSVVLGRSQLNEAIDEADRMDPGWRLMDLEQARAIIPDEQNSALQVLKVDRLIPKNWWDEEKEPSQSLELIKEALLAARKLATYHNGRYPFKPTKSLRAYSLTESAHRVFYVLDCDARCQSNKGKTNQAMVSCRALVAVARSIGDEPYSVSQIGRDRIRNWAVRSIERTLAQGETSEGILRELQSELKIEESEPLLLTIARADRASWHECLQSCENGDQRLIDSSLGPGFDPAVSSKVFLPNSHAWIIRYFNSLVEACKGPTDKQRDRIETLAASISSAPAQVKLIFGDAEVFLKITDTVLASRALLRCAVTALACEHFRLRNNRWPRTLFELVPDYLAEGPCDPLGTPLQFQILDDKVTISAVRF